MEIKNKIMDRDILYVKMKKNPADHQLKNEFKKFNQSFKNKIRYNKKQHFEEKFSSCDNSNQKQWDLIRDVLDPNPADSIKSIMKDDGVETTDMQEIVESFNMFFVNVVKNVIPRSGVLGECTLKHNATSLFYLRKTTPAEINDIIVSLKSNAAPGFDGIKTKTVKKLSDIISPLISAFINKDLKNGHFPDILKRAKVSPIFKKGKKNEMGNYRPISVLCVFSKIFEMVIKNRLLKFLEENSIIGINQNGFLTKKSTQTAIATLMEFIYKNIEEDKTILAIFLDLCKAFDVVDHGILLQKLKIIGIEGNCLSLFKNYLKNRVQYTSICGYNSVARNVQSGVPQGSVLGPILFLVYINDVFDCRLKGSITLFADDTALFYAGRADEVFEQGQQDLATITHWTTHNNIRLNEDKCNYIIFNSRQDYGHRQLKINSTVLKEQQRVN